MTADDEQGAGGQERRRVIRSTDRKRRLERIDDAGIGVEDFEELTERASGRHASEYQDVTVG